MASLHKSPRCPDTSNTTLESATPNPFARFAYQPPKPSSSEDQRRSIIVPSQTSVGKRKARNNPEDESPMSAIHTSTSLQLQKKKQLNSIHSESSLGSKKVKIYDNLRGLDDHLQSGLDIIFCGINPGQKSSQIGHHYGNLTNHFWSCLHQSGLTSKLLDPRKDYTLPQEFSIGLTNLVSRATVEQSELSKAEQIAGVPGLLGKITQHRPRITCFVGLGIADIVKSVLVPNQRVGNNLKSRAAVGLQPYKLIYPDGNPYETLFYAVSSTSGRVVRYQKADKIQQFTDLRLLVEKMKNNGLDTENLTRVNVPSSSGTTAVVDG